MSVFMSSFKIQTISAILNWLLCNEGAQINMWVLCCYSRFAMLPSTAHICYHAEHHNSTYIGTGLQDKNGSNQMILVEVCKIEIEPLPYLVMVQPCLSNS